MDFGRHRFKGADFEEGLTETDGSSVATEPIALKNNSIDGAGDGKRLKSIAEGSDFELVLLDFELSEAEIGGDLIGESEISFA